MKDIECRKLTAVTFRDTVMFAGAAATHFAIRDGQAGVDDKLSPAVLLPDGDWAVIDKGQRPDGIGLVRCAQHGAERKLMRCFVPWANVISCTYGA